MMGKIIGNFIFYIPKEVIRIINNLFISSIVIILSIISNKFSQKIGIPSLLLFIGLGLFFGSDGIVKVQFDNYLLAEFICSVSLIFIMFYGWGTLENG